MAEGPFSGQLRQRHRCVQCGFVVTTSFGPDRVYRICTANGPGDWLALWLANYGITRWKYLAWKRWLYAKLGLPVPKNCGCGQRQERINSLYFELRAWWKRKRK